MRSQRKAAITPGIGSILAVLLVACSGSGPSTSVVTLPTASPASVAAVGSSAAPSATHQVAQALAYAECMRANGVSHWPDPDSHGVFPKSQLELDQLGVGAAQLGGAEAACQDLLPNTSGSSARPTPDAAQALVYAQCMRSHGVSNFPDPDSTGRIPDPASVGIDQGAPRFLAANEACGQYRPPYIPSNAQYSTWTSSQP